VIRFTRYKMSALGDVASAITGALGSVGNFFSASGSDISNFMNFLATDVVDFFTDVEDDVRSVISFLSTAVSDISTFMENIASEFVSALQTVANAIYNAGITFVNFMETLAKDAVNALASLGQDILNFVLNVAQGFANTFSQVLTNAFNLMFNAFNGKLQYISPFVTALPALLANYFGPAMVGKYAETLIDKIARFLPKIDVDLSPLGIGGHFKIDLPKLAKGIVDPLKDFMNDVIDEITTTFKEFIKEPFIADFKIHLREVFNAIGLGDIPFAEPQFAQIQNWVAVRSFAELKPHFTETLLLTGFPAWFTNAYLQEPVDDYIPQNPLFKPVNIRDVIQGVEYGFLPADAVTKYAWNNLIAPKTAQLMYQNTTARFIQRAIEQGIRQFVVTPSDAVSLLQSYATLTGTDLLTKYYNLEYQYAEKRLVRQVLRSLLSRALSNYGRPYIDPNVLNQTIKTLFQQLQYPDIVQQAFSQLISQSQQIQFAQLIYNALIAQIRQGFYNAQTVNNIISQYQMNATVINELISLELTQLQQKAQLTQLQFEARNFMLSQSDILNQLKSLGYADQLANVFVFQYYQEPLLQFQLKYVEQFANAGYYDSHTIKSVLQSLGLTKDFADLFEQYATQAIQYKSLLQEIQFKLKNFLLTEKDAEHLLKAQHFSDALISAIITQYYVEPLTQFRLKYVEEFARAGYYDANAIKSAFQSLGLTKEFAELFESYTTQSITNKSLLQEVQFKLKNFLLSEKDAEHLLKSHHFNDALISAIITQYYTEPLTQFRMRYVEQFANAGYYDSNAIKSAFEGIGLTKDFAELFESYVSQSLQYKSLLQEVQFKLKNFLLSDKDATNLLKSYHISEALISAILTQYYVEPLTQLQLRYVESLAKTQLLDEKELQKLLATAGIVKDIAEIYAKMYASQYYTTALISYYKMLASHGILKESKEIPVNVFNLEIKPAYDLYVLSASVNYLKALASHGILEQSKDVPANVFDLEIKPVFDEFLITITLRYLEQSLKSMAIDAKTALAELKKLKIPENVATMIVNMNTPTLYSVRTIIQNIIEGAIYNVQKVPVNVGHVTAELKKLNVPENQIPILVDEFVTSFALEQWKKYLPTLSDVETAVKTGYPYQKILQLAMIPSALLNLKLDLLQHQQLATLAQSMRSYYVELLVYGVAQTQLEDLLRKYGYNDAMLSMLRTEAQLKRELMVYEELGITPSKALSISEYVENPDDFLKSIFDAYHVPADLQKQYLTYAKNRRLHSYVSEIISTLEELAERGKITIQEAQQYLNQFKKYGLTDDEIQLILLNLQLRAKLESRSRSKSSG